MRKYLTSTLLTSLAGLAWRNRHRLFDRKKGQEGPKEPVVTPTYTAPHAA